MIVSWDDLFDRAAAHDVDLAQLQDHWAQLDRMDSSADDGDHTQRTDPEAGDGDHTQRTDPEAGDG